MRFLLVLAYLGLAGALLVPRQPSMLRRGASTSTRLHILPEASLLVSAALDYSAEIEQSVGTEVYTPIFKAGLGLFASGILAAFTAAFIISKADSFGDLADEFERGKETQLIASDMNAKAGPAPATPAEQPSSSVPAVPTTTATQDAKGLDL